MIYASHTYYSLLYGTMRIDQLVGKSLEHGISTLAITDINNTAACLDFVKECRSKCIKPICGVECRDNDTWLYTCLARNNEGFREINELLSHCNLSGKPIPVEAPRFAHVFVIYPVGSKDPEQLRENEYIAVRPYEINRARIRHHQWMKKLIAFCQVSFAGAEDYELHKHLRAVDHNTLLTMLSPEQMAHQEEYFRPARYQKMLYESCPELVRNAEQLMEMCSFEFEFKVSKNKQVFTGNKYEDKLLLEKLAIEGMYYRYGKSNLKAKETLTKELKVIDELGFCAYFLIAWDIIRHTMSKGVYHVGRGSGGNSVVAYCLKITDIDPIELNLYFERFINPERTSPPDFDIDFSWRDRDMVHEYIFQRYGRAHTALLGATNTFGDSSIIRELGKVYGLPKNDIDALVERPGSPLLKNDISDKILSYITILKDFPHHRSIHAGGVLISERPIYYYTALDLPPKGLPTTQWDMYSAETIGFEKLDILSQRGLGHIKECTEIVKRNRGVDIDVHQVNAFKQDADINQRLYNGEAIGCFYIESPAMRGLLKKLRCNNYLSLVAASSIIRPGVAQSGMMREYIRRFHDQSNVKYLHPIFEEQLKETYGVMVYQEDVIKIAHHFAGLTLASADVLRRAMSGKYRSRQEFDRITKTFFTNCKERGYSDSLTNEVWRQMSSFAGYAFCKAHSASYAVESYQSLYLKTNFPHEFHVAVINNFGGFYRTWVYVNEARRHGARINLPDINKSDLSTTIYGDEIYLGWVHVKNLEEKVCQQIVEERIRNGVYKDLFDFIDRVTIGLEQLRTLIKVGAFRFTGKTKKELMWAQLLRNKAVSVPQSRPLFKEDRRELTLPPLRNSTLEDAYDEMELIGFPVSMSRFDMLQTSYRGDTSSQELLTKIGRKVRMVGEYVTVKYVSTVKREIMHFGCFLDVHGEFFDTVHFPDSLKKYPFTGGGVYLMEGKVVQEFDYPSVEIQKLARLPYKADPRVE
ncbi:MAG: DNA polymerase III subunit alpha [Bacteroidetes bacterium]|nr:DNA polymerase III subunit alpha [Bacteroidota bacterium]